LANHSSADKPSPKEQSPSATKKRSATPARRANRVQTDNSDIDLQAQIAPSLEPKADTSPSSSDFISIGCGTLSVIVFIMGVFYSLYLLVRFLFFK